MSEPMITYANKQDPKGQRFRQYKKDPIPNWAVDIKPDDEELKSWKNERKSLKEQIAELNVKLEFAEVEIQRLSNTGD
jgi:hypothetical protein